MCACRCGIRVHLKNGRVHGAALARVMQGKGAVAVVDAEEGLAFPACDLAVAEAMRRAAQFGIGFVGVVRSLSRSLATVAGSKVTLAGSCSSGLAAGSASPRSEYG